MKNLLLLFSLIIFKSSTVKAQEFVYFGAKGGLNLTTMNSDNFYDEKSRTGFHLGLLAEIPLGNRFSLQPELLYSTHGTKAGRIFEAREHNNPREFHLDYLQVPVLVKLYLTKSLSIESGPSFNFLISEKINGNEADYGSTFEFGGALGASYRLRAGFFVNARYVHGFTDAYTDVFPREYDDKSNNTGFQLGIGFMF